MLSRLFEALNTVTCLATAVPSACSDASTHLCLRSNCVIELERKVDEARKMLEEAYNQYGPQRTAVSFNGGKDATVCLWLWLDVMRSKKNSKQNQPRAVFFKSDQEIDEVVSFLRKTTEQQGLDLKTYEGHYTKCVGKAVDDLKEGQKFADDCPVAFILGVRKGDARSENVKSIEPSTLKDVKFMRYHPLLNWTYGDIWAVIKFGEIPYCSLYDKGYSSLGDRKDTIKNPALSKGEKFIPASQLEDPSSERASRK